MRLSGLSRIDLARAVRAGELSREEAGEILLGRAMRKLWRLERKLEKQASDQKAATSSTVDA